MLPEALIAKFWEHVNKDGPVVVPSLGQCWMWTGNIGQYKFSNGSGYGLLAIKKFGYAARKDGRETAHRLSWLIHYGDIGDKQVCHRCDNPPCVRPEHLFLATFTENHADKIAKHRNPWGDQHGTRKLDSSAIREIRWLYDHGVTQTGIAQAYGVNRSNVSMIANRVTWKSVL